MINLYEEVQNYLLCCEKQKNLSPHTMKAYKIDLLQYLSLKNDLKRENLKEYINVLHDNFKPKTVRRKIASLKAFIRYLYCNDIIESNPFDKINISFKEPYSLPRIIPKNILCAVMEASYCEINAANSEYAKAVSVRNAAIIELLFATGARVSEICSLKVESIDLSAHTVRIFGKGSKERIVNIENEDVLNILIEYKSIYHKNAQTEDYFFLNSRKRRLSEQSVRFMLRHFEEKLNLNFHITPHMFRHSVATMLLEEDVDIRYIQKFLGHSSITTTQIYTHVTSNKQREIFRTKHPRNKLFE